MIKKADMSNHCDGKRYRSFMFADVHQADAASGRLCRWLFKSNVRETWRVILVSKADIFHTESLRVENRLRGRMEWGYVEHVSVSGGTCGDVDHTGNYTA